MTMRTKALFSLSTILLPLFAILVTTLAFYFNINNIQNYYFNSDSLYGVDLIRDFLHSPSSIKNWLVPQAPFVFPDFLFLLPGTILKLPTSLIFLSALVFQIITLVYLLRGIGKRLISGINVKYLDSLITIIIVSGLIYPEPGKLLYSLEWHFGNSIGILLMIDLVLRNHKTKSFYLNFVILLCSFFLGLSDSFYLLQFTFPLLLVHIYTRFRKKNSLVSDFMAFSIVATSYLGYRSLKVFFWNSSRQQIKINVGEMKVDLISLWRLLLETSQQLPFFIGIVMLVLIPWASVGRLISRNQRITKSTKATVLISDELLYLSAIFRISLILSTLVIAVVPALEPTYRYVSFYFVFGFYWAGLMIYGFLLRVTSWKGIPNLRFGLMAQLVSYFLVLIFIISFCNIVNTKHVLTPSNATTRCLDSQIASNNLGRGVASYWLARYYSNFLQTKPEIVAINADLTDFLWITNWTKYNGEFNFALIENSGLDPFKVTLDTVSRIPGMVKSHNCGDVTIIFGGKFSVQLPIGF